MNRTSVTSSNIKSIGYDPSSSTLEIEFLSGDLYQYHEVPQSKSDAIMRADSHGKYLNSDIKPHHRFTQIR